MEKEWRNVSKRAAVKFLAIAVEGGNLVVRGETTKPEFKRAEAPGKK